jgi:hypothetical protein
MRKQECDETGMQQRGGHLSILKLEAEEESSEEPVRRLQEERAWEWLESLKLVPYVTDSEVEAEVVRLIHWTQDVRSA